MSTSNSAPQKQEETSSQVSPLFVCGIAIFLVLGVVGPLQVAGAQEYSEEKTIWGPCSACKVQAVHAADLDSDGDQDVLVGSKFPYVGWFENKENGFSELKRFSKQPGGVKESFAFLTTADLSDDNKADVLTGLNWYKNRGNGSFSAPKFVDGNDIVGDAPSRAADLVGDSREDVIVSTSKISIYENGNFTHQPGGTGIPSRFGSFPGRLFPSLTLDDIDADGDTDILASAGRALEGHEAKWFENLDEGGFAAGQTFGETPRKFFGSIRPADLDGDGDRDVLTFRGSPSGGSGSLAWHENIDGIDSLGRGQIIVENELSTEGDARPIDLDEDGDQDVVTQLTEGVVVQLVWLENRGDGTFKDLEVLASTGGLRAPLETSDLNGDGRKDVLYPMPSRGVVRWRPNLEEGLLGEARTMGQELGVTSRTITESADVDGDGRNDLFLSAFDTDYLSRYALEWVERTPTGFSEPETVAPFLPSEFVTSEINGDSATDFVYVREDRTYEGRGQREVIGWAENDGSGTFALNQIDTDLSAHGPLATADVDGDGDRDLIDHTASKTRVYQNDDGALKGGTSHRVTIGGESNLTPLLTSDLDGDGDEDLVAKNPAALVWYENEGNDWDFAGGTDDFSDAKKIDESNNDNRLPEVVESADVDSDGDIDLIAYGRITRWYENLDGEGTFSNPKSLDLGAVNRRVIGENYRVADVDGDSDPDILAFDGPFEGATYQDNALEEIDYGSRTLWWRENKGGTFTERKALIEGANRPRELHTFKNGKVGPVNIAYRSEDYQKIAWYQNESAVVASKFMAADEAADLSETGTEISLSSNTQGSGTVTVRQPFSGPVGREGLGDASLVGNYRLVVENDVSLSVGSGSELRISASSIPGLHQPTKATIFVRDTVDRGTFQSVETTYDSGTDRLVATTGRFGEVVIGTGADKAAPDTPMGLTARASADSVALTWMPSDSADVTTYRVYRSTAPIDPAAGPSSLTALDTVDVGQTNYTHGGLQPDITYHYRVTAVDDNLNESGFSVETRATPHPVRITSLQPERGTPGTQMRVYGAGFALSASGVTVKVGGTVASVDSVTSTAIFAKVPRRTGGPAPVSVTSGGASRTAAARFGVITSGETAFFPLPSSLEGVKRIKALDEADYDGDGDLDVALIGKDTNDTAITRIYQNRGNGTFKPIDVNMPGYILGSLAWGDYDNDGDPDLAVYGDKTVGSETTLYENRGGGTFEPAGLDVSGGRSVAWVDYNGDGHLDLLKERHRFYKNQGDGTFSPVDVSSVGIPATGAIDWADFDGDGDLDAAVVGMDGDRNRTTTIYENKGNGTFSPLGAGLTDLDRGGAAWGDYDGDEDPDLVVAGKTGSGKETILYQNRGGGTFDPVQAELTDIGRFGGVPALSWGDFDGDGALDLFLAGQTSGGSQVTKLFTNQGSGSFQAADSDFTGISSIGEGFTGDFSGDGDLDLILSGEDEFFTQKALLYENGRSPLPPPELTATAAADDVVLDWEVSSSSSVQRYRIYRDTAPIDSAAGPSFSPLDSTTAENTSYTDTAVEADKTYYYRVTAVSSAGAESSFSGRGTVTSETQILTRTVSVASGWNMVGMPVEPGGASSKSLGSALPSGCGDRFQWDPGQGLYQEFGSGEALPAGGGAWTFCESSGTATVEGPPASDKTVSVAGGWNQVGPFETAIAPSEVGQDPSGLLQEGTWFRWDPSQGNYAEPTELAPGAGYWVFATESGTLDFSGAGSAATASAGAAEAQAKGSAPAQEGPEEALKLNVTDGAGHSRAVYLASELSEEEQKRWRLPPTGPGEAFDVRFAGGFQAAEAGGDSLGAGNGAVLQLQGTEGRATLRLAAAGEELEGRSVQVLGARAGRERVDARLTAENSSVRVPAQAERLRLQVEEVPQEAALGKPSPNPSSGRATLEYGLPEEREVTIKVYDVLGRRVARLVDERRPAGTHRAVLKAGRLPSGTYFARMRAGSFQKTRRITILK